MQISHVMSPVFGTRSGAEKTYSRPLFCGRHDRDPFVPHMRGRVDHLSWERGYGRMVKLAVFTHRCPHTVFSGTTQDKRLSSPIHGWSQQSPVASNPAPGGLISDRYLPTCRGRGCYRRVLRCTPFLLWTSPQRIGLLIISTHHVC